jgi:hypothetical protein
MSSRELTGYEAFLDALEDTSASAEKRASALDQASGLIRDWPAAHDPGVTARAARAMATALSCLADFERWEADTAAAEVDAERHRRSAEFKARREVDGLDAADPVLGALKGVLERIVEVRALEQRTGLREMLARIPVPMALIDAPAAPRAASARRAPAPTPRAAIIPAIDGSPVTHAHAIEPGRVHELEVEARVLDWPERAEELVLRFLSHWPRTAVEVTDVHLARPQEETDGVRIVRGMAHLALHAASADPTKPVRLTVEGQLSGDADAPPLRLLGHRELAVRTFDPERDVITGAPALDERIAAMLAELREHHLAPREQEPFGRFLGAIARAAVRIQMEREFPEGTNPTEKDFQQELLKRVAMASELGGRVQEHAWQAGGPTDLSHDGVVAELKVERHTAATVENAARYMAQPTQYASGGQRQLSILVILDMTTKDAPPGVLANTIGWLEPALHGLEDPAYPSRVATVIVNGNLPLPSSWST